MAFSLVAVSKSPHRFFSSIQQKSTGCVLPCRVVNLQPKICLSAECDQLIFPYAPITKMAAKGEIDKREKRRTNATMPLTLSSVVISAFSNPSLCAPELPMSVWTQLYSPYAVNTHIGHGYLTPYEHACVRKSHPGSTLTLTTPSSSKCIFLTK